MRTQNKPNTGELLRLYESLSPEGREMIDDRALALAIVDQAGRDIQAIDRGQPLSRESGISWGWPQIERALIEALGAAKASKKTRPKHSVRPHQIPGGAPTRYPRVEA